MSSIKTTTLTALVFLSLSLLGCGSETLQAPPKKKVSRTLEQKSGSKFIPEQANSKLFVEIVDLTQIGLLSNADAIWGATGRDEQGNIYFGVSTHGGPNHTAQLFQLNPKSGMVQRQGEVISQLHKAGLYRDGIGQNKLHSKFIQADDGYLYFSSFDEGGEAEGINPIWGGHLWRKKPDSPNWEHLLHAEHALVAVNTNGRYVYALGYWDHVLYQYDIVTARLDRVTVGSYRKHMSRNFLVDSKGHAYVPRMALYGESEPIAYLDEYNHRLKLVDSYRMAGYRVTGSGSSHHGIVGYATLANGNMAFTTSEGMLYLIQTKVEGPDKLKALGFVHPDGKSYAPGLFSVDGSDHLAILAKRPKQKLFIWLDYDLSKGRVVGQQKLELPVQGHKLLYGSITRDDDGAFYLVGWDNRQPLLVKLSYSTQLNTQPTDTQATTLSSAAQQALAIIKPRLTNGLLDNGFSKSQLSKDWTEAKENKSVRLYTQARVVYLFTEGYRITGDKDYLNAVKRSADFMLNTMFQASNGTWLRTAHRSGKRSKQKAAPYDTSFAVFALSHAYDVTRDPEYLNAALATWEKTTNWPGLIAAKNYTENRSVSVKNGVWYQNPFMHLFEALLALYDVSGEQRVWADIKASAQFVKNKLQQPEGSIPEYFYNRDFQPQAMSDGGHVILGHQIEWAYLIHQAVDRGLSEEFRLVASGAYRFAIKAGWKASEGRLLKQSDYSGNATTSYSDWWSQAEMMRLTHYLATNGYNSTENWQRFAQSEQFVSENLIDHEFGGWFGRPQNGSTSKSSKVIGYHAVAAYAEIARGATLSN